MLSSIQLINKSIRNQVQHYYSFNVWCCHYWWSLTMFLMSAAVYNSYYLYKLIHLNSKLSHKNFQHEVAMKLVQNSAENERKWESTVQLSGEKDAFTLPDHHYIKLSKKKYCEACRMKKSRPKKWKILEEIDDFGNKRQLRASETTWTCEGCMNKSICRQNSCWEAIH